MTLRTKEGLLRIFSAAVALPVYAFFIIDDHFYSLGILLVSLVISLACLYEFYQISALDGRGKPFVIPGVLAGVGINLFLYMFAFGRVYGFDRYVSPYDVRPLFMLIIGLGIVVSVLQVAFRPIQEGIYSLASTVFGVVFIVIPFSHIILMKALPDGIHYIVVLHIVIMLNDTFAYFGGMFFGRHKSGFEVSPNKSWEGYFSGMLFSIISTVVANEIMRIFFDKMLFAFIEAIILGVVLSILGNLGDLIESAVKRDAEIKDSGTIIPGHGGMWDVFDALIFVFPVFYYYLYLKKMIGF